MDCTTLNLFISAQCRKKPAEVRDMIVICPQCGSINQVKKLDLSKPVIDVICRNCGGAQSLKIGTTSQSRARAVCPQCGFKQPQVEKCLKCGTDMYTEAQESAFDREALKSPSLISLRYKAIIIVALAMVVMIFLGSIAGVFLMMKTSDAYTLAERYIRQSEEIRQTVGDDIKFGLIPMGSISTSGTEGRAHFTVRVKGSRGTTDVSIYLRKYEGKWHVVSAAYSDLYGINRTLIDNRKKGDQGNTL
jgi:predicted RNA-binding Zn-ribbon protein involved in translation (DUF1610 family)